MARLDERAAGKVMDLLEEVMLDGVAKIRTAELLVIYGQERLTKGITRDVRDRWAALCEDREYETIPELLVARGENSGMVAFAFGRDVNEETNELDVEPFFTPIDELLGKSKDD